MGHLSFVHLSIDGRWACPCLLATEDAVRESLPRGGAARSGSRPTPDIFEDYVQAFHPSSPGFLAGSVSSRPILHLAYSDGTSKVTRCMLGASR